MKYGNDIDLKPNQEGLIQGPVESQNPKSIGMCLPWFNCFSVNGMNVTVSKIIKSVEEGGDALINETVYTLVCDSLGEHVGDLVIRIDQHIPSGKVGTYTWIPKTESDELLDTEGIMEYLNGIEVV